MMFLRYGGVIMNLNPKGQRENLKDRKWTGAVCGPWQCPDGNRPMLSRWQFYIAICRSTTTDGATCGCRRSSSSISGCVAPSATLVCTGATSPVRRIRQLSNRTASGGTPEASAKAWWCWDGASTQHDLWASLTARRRFQVNVSRCCLPA